MSASERLELLHSIEHGLLEDLAKTRSVEDRIALQQQVTRVRRQIAALQPKQAA